MPVLSVIVTSYNIEDYLAGCLDTVINQSLRDMEIIVVDDGSSDRTPDIIREYAEKDSRIRPILLPENTIGGVASAANAGLDAATGEYIGFADGDDYLELDMFETLVTAARTHQSDLAMCKYLLVDAVGDQKAPAEKNRWNRFQVTERIELDSDEATIEILRFIAVPWRKIYRRELIEANKIRFPVVDYFWEDNPFHWFSVCAASDIVVVPKVLCYHRVGRVGQTMSTRDAGLLKMFGHYQTIRDWLGEKDLLGRFQVTLLAWAISQFEWIHKRLPQETGVQLYDTMARIVRPVDEDIYSAALEGKSVKTAEILGFVRSADRPSFLTAFGKQFRDDRAPASSNPVGRLKPKLDGARQLVRRGRDNLKTRGFRDTLSRVKDRLSRQNKLLARIFGSRGAPATEKNMLAYLTLLQRDMERKHQEQLDRLQAIEEELRELREKQQAR
ncbi:MAG: glycosyltransferase [Maritimibacter sp.]|nr:glycosyltransferase [Maritimibacter sp.]